MPSDAGDTGGGDTGRDAYELREWQRFNKGYRERFVDDVVITLLCNNRTLRLRQAPSANSSRRRPQQLDKQSDPALTGCTVWDGAVVLAQFVTCYLQQQQQQQQQQQLQQQQNGSTSNGALCCHHQQPLPAQQQQRCVSLELGAGTGGVSLALLAAGLVQRALITDIPDMLPHLQLNVHHNNALVDPGRALVRQLRWGEAADVAALQPHAPPFDLILGSDLVYYSYTPETPHSRLLLLALTQLSGPGTSIYLALSLHHNPGEVRAFLRWAREAWGFSCEEMTAHVPAEYRVHDVLVVRLRLADAGKAAAAAAAAARGTLQREY